MYQIRKCERYTSWQTSKISKLDPNKFKSISVPFTGKSEKEFLHYISDNLLELRDIYKEFDIETQSELEKLWEPEWTEYANSTWKEENSWYESGKPNKEYRKDGGFESIFSTNKKP